MQNKFLTAFLALATISLTAQQPSNTELITNLRLIKNEIQSDLLETVTESKKRLNKSYSPKITMIWEELFATEAAGPYALMVDFYFHVMQNQTIKSLNELCSHDFDQKGFDNLEKQDELIHSIFVKIYQYDTKTIESIMKDFMCTEHWESSIVFSSLLRKIDAKIKELEMQVN